MADALGKAIVADQGDADRSSVAMSLSGFDVDVLGPGVLGRQRDQIKRLSDKARQQGRNPVDDRTWSIRWIDAGSARRRARC